MYYVVINFFLDYKGPAEINLVSPLTSHLNRTLNKTLGNAGQRLRFQFEGLLSASNHPLTDLRFVASTAGPSAIVSLLLTNATATDYAGVTLTRAGTVPGLVVVINREPVLLGRMNPGRMLRLYGRPGMNYAIESKPGLTIPVPWEQWTKFTLVDRFNDLDVGDSDPFVLFRALETGAGLRLTAHHDTGPVFLTVTGEPGPGYRLEGATLMPPLGNWQTLTTFTLSNDHQVLTLPATNLPMRFFRVVKP